MSDLPIGQAPIVMPSYPHMMPLDAAIWTVYLKNPLAKMQRVWYDLHVGQMVSPVVSGDDLGQRISAGVTRKRIDVVARVGGGFWVIEVKPFAGYVALGQVVTYLGLFIKEFRPLGQVIPIVVCDQVDPDLVDDFEVSGVGVIVI